MVDGPASLLMSTLDKNKKKKGKTRGNQKLFFPFFPKLYLHKNMNSSLDPSVNGQTSKECEICHTEDWKYTCPRCLIHTCSVPCVKKHKLDTQCSGERDKTAYVPLKSYNESTMMNGK